MSLSFRGHGDLIYILGHREGLTVRFSRSDVLIYCSNREGTGYLGVCFVHVLSGTEEQPELTL